MPTVRGTERIVFTLVHKFATAAQQPECYNPSADIVALVDEGHRSHGGQLHERLRRVLPRDEAVQAFMTQAVISLSDTFFYPAPMAFQLKDFTHVQASVFQVARAPGQSIVYLGCLLLIVGIFAMLYVRERRLWVWLTPTGGTGTQATMALSSNRKTMDGDREFDLLKTQLLKGTP